MIIGRLTPADDKFAVKAGRVSRYPFGAVISRPVVGDSLSSDDICEAILGFETARSDAEQWCQDNLKAGAWVSHGRKFAFKHQKDAALFIMSIEGAE